MVEICRLGPDDAAAAAAFVEMIDRPPPEEVCARAWLEDERNVMVGAWVAGRPAGMAYGYRLARPDAGADMLLLYSIDVDESHRRRGLGAKLVEAMRRETDGGMWLVTNESNAAAMALYERTGGERGALDDVVLRFSRPR